MNRPTACIDTRRVPIDNYGMSLETKPIIDSDALRDLQSLLDSAAARKPVDGEVAKRVQQRSQEIRNRLPETNLAVELVRDARDQ